MFFKHLTLN